MKKSLSIVSLLLAVIMIAMCCVGCGDSKKSEGNTIVGTWTTELDFDKLMSTMSGGAGAMQQMVEMMKDAFSGVKLKLNLTFNEDGTCVAAADKDSVEAASEKIRSGLVDTLSAMGLPQDQVDTVLDSIDLSSMVNGSTKKYETDGNKLYIYDDETGKDEKNYVEYELSSSELKVTKISGEVEEIPEGILPLVLTRVS